MRQNAALCGNGLNRNHINRVDVTGQHVGNMYSLLFPFHPPLPFQPVPKQQKNTCMF